MPGRGGSRSGGGAAGRGMGSSDLTGREIEVLEQRSRQQQ